MCNTEKHIAEGSTRRSFLINAVAALVGLTLEGKIIGQQSSFKTYEFINDYWFDGQKFKNKRFYSIGGILKTKKPREIDSVIDLNGKYIVPYIRVSKRK